MKLERILDIIENGEFKEIKKQTLPPLLTGASMYDVITNNGGMIRLTHENEGKVLFSNKVSLSKEKIKIRLFVPGEEECISMAIIESDSKNWNRVYGAWRKVVNSFKEDYSKFF